MSFTKKLSHFLHEAKAQDVIGDESYQKLQAFACEQMRESSANAFINIIGFFGGLAIILGLILTVSHNWSQIPDLVKIVGYLVTLSALYAMAYFSQTEYPKVSEVLYFIASGYVLAGIGLIAQIYHLSSSDGRAFLLWFVLILPLALLLKQKWLAAICMFSFFLWLTINSIHHHYINDFKSFLIYCVSIIVSLIVIPPLAALRGMDLTFIKQLSVQSLALMILIMGFGHELPLMKASALSLHPVTTIILMLNIFFLGYLFFQNSEDGDDLFATKLGISSLLIVIATPFLIGFCSGMVISILYWAIWIYFCGISIYYGVTKGDSSVVSHGVRFGVLGIMIRFVDIVGTMLFTGTMFILFGVILLAIVYYGEKYRKYLTNKVSQNAS